MKTAFIFSTFVASLFLMTSAYAHGSKIHDKGEALYLKHCASCHGVDGDGTGEAGIGLNPPPANLLESLDQKIVSDEYLMWTIKEGGRNVHTNMPSFENEANLDEHDAEAIIHFLRDAFQ